MKIVVNLGRRDGNVGSVTLLRERPLGYPVWVRILILLGVIALWLGFWLPRITV